MTWSTPLRRAADNGGPPPRAERPAAFRWACRRRVIAGISEVILYFNYGLKPHAQVKEQMARFMEEIAPAFEGAHQALIGGRTAAPGG